MVDADALPKTMRWYRMDLHIHTPASEDYVEKETSYLDILKEAERRGLDMIAFTDHNTIAGYEALHDEIEFLERLEQRNRLQEHEREELAEYRRLLQKITVLPGFEFTCRFGSHTLGIFPPGGHAPPMTSGAWCRWRSRRWRSWRLPWPSSPGSSKVPERP